MVEDLNRVTLIGSVEYASYDCSFVNFRVMTKDIVRDARSKKMVERLAFHRVFCDKDVVDGVIVKGAKVFLEGGIKNNVVKDNGTVSSEIEAHVVEVLKDERDNEIIF